MYFPPSNMFISQCCSLATKRASLGFSSPAKQPDTFIILGLSIARSIKVCMTMDIICKSRTIQPHTIFLVVWDYIKKTQSAGTTTNPWHFFVRRSSQADRENLRGIAAPWDELATYLCFGHRVRRGSFFYLAQEKFPKTTRRCATLGASGESRHRGHYVNTTRFTLDE